MKSILKRHSVLYVEDEPEIQANVAEYLEHQFGHVFLAANGQEALEQYHKHRPDVLLLDINLPIKDGLAVATEIRKTDQCVKIIMLTAYTEKDKLLTATELRLTKYLVKPVTPKMFKETLETLAGEILDNPSQFMPVCETYTWDKKKEHLIFNNKIVKFAEKQQRLLKLFIGAKGHTVNYDKIIIELWENAYDRDISINSVKNQVSQLRKALPKLNIISVYGEGYALR